MAHLWTNDGGGWNAASLVSPLFDLGTVCACEPAAERSAKGDGGRAGAASTWSAQLLRSNAGGAEAWALVATPGAPVRVNGEALPAGLRVLADRDEVRIAMGRPRFFSTETLAQIEPYPGSEGEQTAYCGRCRDGINAGAAAIRCPGCGVWYHQSADLPCWAYSDGCAFCGQPTALDAGFKWTPEDEGL